MSFESLLRTQGQVVRDVGSAFGLKPVGVEPKTEPKRIGPNTNEHDDYFARRDAIIITQQLLEVINGHVDPVVLEMAGYRCAEHVCELAALDNLVAAGSDPSGNTTADKEAP